MLTLESYDWHRFRPRILIDVSKIDTTTTILGYNISMPIMVAPTAMQKMAHPEGRDSLFGTCHKSFLTYNLEPVHARESWLVNYGSLPSIFFESLCLWFIWRCSWLGQKTSKWYIFFTSFLNLNATSLQESLPQQGRLQLLAPSWFVHSFSPCS